MRKLLISLLAALALPTAVNAETWWLMAAGRYGNSSYNWSIPTNSEKECEFAGQNFLNKKWRRIILTSDMIDYVCVKGK